ncbi:MAG: hypothetical protein Q4F43_07640, partial [Eubacteriales bacterium]|nr:hypothetical protein [Eubacteriales bacterium]
NQPINQLTDRSGSSVCIRTYIEKSGSEAANYCSCQRDRRFIKYNIAYRVIVSPHSRSVKPNQKETGKNQK